MSTTPGAAALACPIEDYAGAERFLLALVRDEPRPYRERAAIAQRAVRDLLAALGNPHERMRFLHVAGSKGKGSVALLAEALLLEAGVSVGTFTSPHLRRWNERFRIGGRAVDDALLTATLERLRPLVVERLARQPELAPSFFDVLVAAAMWMFAEDGCDLVVLEAGLGGRQDATNVVKPSACCITSVELEHTDKLGDSLEEIAGHKAGIIKPVTPVVTGPLPAPALLEVGARTRQLGSPWWRLGHDYFVDPSPADGARQWVRYRDGSMGARFELPHPSPHMAINAGIAIACVRALGVTPDARVLARVTLPGRAQLLRARPWILVDSAHTPASLGALARVLERYPARQRRFVVSATRGKAPAALAALLRAADHVTVTCADPLRSRPAADLLAELRGRLPDIAMESVADPRSALLGARRSLPDDGLLCICGSVYLAGIGLELFAP